MESVTRNVVNAKSGMGRDPVYLAKEIKMWQSNKDYLQFDETKTLPWRLKAKISKRKKWNTSDIILANTVTFPVAIQVHEYRWENRCKLTQSLFSCKIGFVFEDYTNVWKKLLYYLS